MTANALQGDKERCLAAGMDDYISKPVKLGNIKSAIEKWAPQGQGHKRQDIVDQTIFNTLLELDVGSPGFIQRQLVLFESFVDERLKILEAAAAGTDLAEIDCSIIEIAECAKSMGATALVAVIDNILKRNELFTKSSHNEILESYGTLKIFFSTIKINRPKSAS